MRLLTAKQNHPNKIPISLKDLTYAKRSGRALPEILKGDKMENPIEVLKHGISPKPRYGASGQPYFEKEFSVWRGSQRVKAAKKLGYTHIEGVIINE